MLLDYLIDSTIFIGSHPSVDQTVSGGMNLGSFLPGVRTDATALQRDFQCVFLAYLFASMTAFACFHLTIEQPLWEAHIRHAAHMPCPSQLRCLEQCMYAHDVYSMENFYIWNHILPFYMDKLSEAPDVKEVQLLWVVTVDCPSLTNIQKVRQSDCTVHLEFGLQSNTSSFPYTGLSSAKNHTCTCSSLVAPFIDDDCPW